MGLIINGAPWGQTIDSQTGQVYLPIDYIVEITGYPGITKEFHEILANPEQREIAFPRLRLFSDAWGVTADDFQHWFDVYTEYKLAEAIASSPDGEARLSAIHKWLNGDGPAPE